MAQSISHSPSSFSASATAMSARVVGAKGYWSVFLRNTEGEWPLVVGRNMRVFRHFETVVMQLKARGIHQFQVDIEQAQAADIEVVISPLRPKVLKRALGAEAYDTWFRSQVNESLQPTASLSNEAVEQAMAQFKARLVAVAP